MLDAIVTNAARMKKPSKTTALDALREMIDSGSLNESNLETLYSFFMPSGPNAKEAKKDNFAWVALAAAKKDVRDYLNYVYVTSDYIVATNGHTLHRVPNLDDMEPGFYHPNGVFAGEPDWQRYPDTDRIMLSEGEKQSFSEDGLPVVEVSNRGKIVYAYKFAGHGLNKQYVDAALVGADQPVSVIVSEGGDKGVQFRYGVRTAVIMPIRL